MLLCRCIVFIVLCNVLGVVWLFVAQCQCQCQKVVVVVEVVVMMVIAAAAAVAAIRAHAYAHLAGAAEDVVRRGGGHEQQFHILGFQARHPQRAARRRRRMPAQRLLPPQDVAALDTGAAGDPLVVGL